MPLVSAHPLSSHLIGAVVVIALGFALTLIGLAALWRYAPKRWRPTNAVVLASDAEVHVTGAGVGPLHAPRIWYRYQLEGADYEGDCYAYSRADDMGSLEAVERILQHYPVGASITIGYLTSNPRVSCIKFDSRYSRSQMWALVWGGVLVMAVGTLVMAGEFG